MKHVALVLLAASLVVVGACSGAGEAADDSSPGRKVYVQAGCGGCHGADLQGLQTAPPLVDLAAHWDQASLTAYLRDPDGNKIAWTFNTSVESNTRVTMGEIITQDLRSVGLDVTFAL